MPNNNVLTEKERELIAVGASVAAGCQPCTTYHVKAANAAGACERGIALAIETAIAGRNSATGNMDVWAKRCQGSQPELDAGFRAEKRLISELTAVATAVAVNSVPDLKTHLAAAKESGASDEQIRSAVEIARQIKRVAGEKIEAAIARSAETGCCGSAPAEARTGCGCR